MRMTKLDHFHYLHMNEEQFYDVFGQLFSFHLSKFCYSLNLSTFPMYLGKLS